LDVSFYTLKRASDGAFVPTPYIMFPCDIASAGFFGIGSTDFENIVQEENSDIVNLLIRCPIIKFSMKTCLSMPCLYSVHYPISPTICNMAPINLCQESELDIVISKRAT
jgi:hypothetical protein